MTVEELKGVCLLDTLTYKLGAVIEKGKVVEINSYILDKDFSQAHMEFWVQSEDGSINSLFPNDIISIEKE